jgi:hypothetical protein
MYMNVISFKNGKTILFKSKTPYSVDKVSEGWNVIIDESDNHAVSFRGSEIVTIESKPIPKGEGKKRPAIQAAVTTE